MSIDPLILDGQEVESSPPFLSALHWLPNATAAIDALGTSEQTDHWCPPSARALAKGKQLLADVAHVSRDEGIPEPHSIVGDGDAGLLIRWRTETGEVEIGVNPMAGVTAAQVFSNGSGSATCRNPEAYWTAERVRGIQ